MDTLLIGFEVLVFPENPLCNLESSIFRRFFSRKQLLCTCLSLDLVSHFELFRFSTDFPAKAFNVSFLSFIEPTVLKCHTIYLGGSRKAVL
jgi:hypothetical protein